MAMKTSTVRPRKMGKDKPRAMLGPGVHTLDRIFDQLDGTTRRPQWTRT